MCVSAEQELLLKLVEDHYPMPQDPDADANAAKVSPAKGRSRRAGARMPRNKVGLEPSVQLHAQ